MPQALPMGQGAAKKFLAPPCAGTTRGRRRCRTAIRRIQPRDHIP
ncbi:MAG: hypothetical protein RLZZ57_3072, partial [Pseudomonadota bacterium]